jgi:hypothetical protein
MTDKPTLDLTSLTERPQVKLPDGTLFDIHSPDEVGPVEYQIVVSRLARISKLQDGATVESLTEESAAQLAKDIDEVMNTLVIGMTPEVLAALGFIQKMRIAQFWGDLAEATTENMSAEGEAESPSTGAPSSPASSVFTGGDPPIGSTLRSA